jgi:MFS family permease
MLACKLYSPITAGVALFPFAMTVVPVSGVTGIIIARLGHYKWALWLGWGLCTVGTGLLVILGVSTPAVAWVFIFMCAGAGHGLLLIGHSVAVQASAKPEDAAHAGGMYSFMRAFGLCLGVVVGGTIFQNFFRMRLAHIGLPTDYATVAEGLVPSVRAMADTMPLKSQLTHAYAWALRMLFATLTAISVLGLLVSLFIGGHSLDTAHERQHFLKGSREVLDEK